MSYFTEPEVKDLQISTEVNITPSGDSILSYLGIDKATVKFNKPITKRTQYRREILQANMDSMTDGSAELDTDTQPSFKQREYTAVEKTHLC